jgi:predicted amidohydrolase
MRVATAQFENRSGDKEVNLARIEELAARAAQSGAQVVAFHECSVTGYTFARRLSREQLWDLAEGIPGSSTDALTRIARRHGVSILAGLFERGEDELNGWKCGILICYDNNVIENRPCHGAPGKWLPARAYDNGVYVVFSNPIGMDDDQLKNGCSMVIDPFGDVP